MAQSFVAPISAAPSPSSHVDGSPSPFSSSMQQKENMTQFLQVTPLLLYIIKKSTNSKNLKTQTFCLYGAPYLFHWLLSLLWIDNGGSYSISNDHCEVKGGRFGVEINEEFDKDIAFVIGYLVFHHSFFFFFSLLFERGSIRYNSVTILHHISFIIKQILLSFIICTYLYECFNSFSYYKPRPLYITFYLSIYYGWIILPTISLFTTFSLHVNPNQYDLHLYFFHWFIFNDKILYMLEQKMELNSSIPISPVYARPKISPRLRVVRGVVFVVTLVIRKGVVLALTLLPHLLPPLRVYSWRSNLAKITSQCNWRRSGKVSWKSATWSLGLVGIPSQSLASLLQASLVLKFSPSSPHSLSSSITTYPYPCKLLYPTIIVVHIPHYLCHYGVMPRTEKHIQIRDGHSKAEKRKIRKKRKESNKRYRFVNIVRLLLYITYTNFSFIIVLYIFLLLLVNIHKFVKNIGKSATSKT